MSFARRPGTIVFLVATAVALVVTWPVVLNPGEVMYGTPGDATGGVTEYWWWGYALTHGKSIFDNTLEGVPLGSQWWEIPYLVLPLIVLAPLTIGFGPVAAYNLLIISSFPLTAWSVYLLARRLGFTAWPSAFAGLAMAFAPYHVEKAQGHGNETHLEFIALTLYFLVRWRQERRLVHAVLAGAMAGLQLWMDYYFTLILAFAVVLFFVIDVLMPEGALPALVGLRRTATGLLAMAAVSLAFLPLAVLAFHRPGQGSLTAALGNVSRDLKELQIYSARPWEFVEPWHANPLVPAFITAWENQHLHGSNWTESSLTLGYVVIALAVLGVFVHRSRFVLALCAGLIAVGGLMAAEPTVHAAGVTLHKPSYYLYQVVTYFRVYARFAILVMLGFVLLAAAGYTALQVRWGPARRPVLLLIPFVVLALEFNNQPPSHVTQVFPAPAEYTWLASQPQGVLMEYPAHSGAAPTLEVEVRQYELYQMVHLHPTFLNESPGEGAVADAAAQLEPYYGSGVAEKLKQYGVRYVFVHRAEYAAAGWLLPTSVPGLTYLQTLNGVDIYIVD